MDEIEAINLKIANLKENFKKKKIAWMEDTLVAEGKIRNTCSDLSKELKKKTKNYLRNKERLAIKLMQMKTQEEINNTIQKEQRRKMEKMNEEKLTTFFLQNGMKTQDSPLKKDKSEILNEIIQQKIQKRIKGSSEIQDGEAEHNFPPEILKILNFSNLEDKEESEKLRTEISKFFRGFERSEKRRKKKIVEKSKKLMKEVKKKQVLSSKKNVDFSIDKNFIEARERKIESIKKGKEVFREYLENEEEEGEKDEDDEKNDDEDKDDEEGKDLLIYLHDLKPVKYVSDIGIRDIEMDKLRDKIMNIEKTKKQCIYNCSRLLDALNLEKEKFQKISQKVTKINDRLKSKVNSHVQKLKNFKKFESESNESKIEKIENFIEKKTKKTRDLEIMVEKISPFSEQLQKSILKYKKQLEHEKERFKDTKEHINKLKDKIEDIDKVIVSYDKKLEKMEQDKNELELTLNPEDEVEGEEEEFEHQ